MTPNDLRAYLKKHKLSQSGLAQHLNVPTETLRRYLNGDREIPRIFEFALAELEERLGQGDL